MRAWTERSVEEAHLLNPAFCSLVLASAVADYAEAAGTGMPFALTFLVPPVVLHRATREALPKNTRTSLAAWLEENGNARLRFAERAQALAPFVREALLFASTRGALAFQGDLVVMGTPIRGRARFVSGATDEVRDCLSRAAFVGKWFAGAGSPQTVMALLGVRP